jgi:hypothetical protein
MFEPVKQKVESLPDMSTLATKTEVQIAKNRLTEYIDNKTVNMAIKSDIPDVSGFLTQPQIENLIDNSDNDDNVTQEEINTLFNT